MEQTHACSSFNRIVVMSYAEEQQLQQEVFEQEIAKDFFFNDVDTYTQFMIDENFQYVRRPKFPIDG